MSDTPIPPPPISPIRQFLAGLADKLRAAVMASAIFIRKLPL